MTDAAGNKIIVCDNGTGVSSISPMVVVEGVVYLFSPSEEPYAFLFVDYLVREVWLRWLEFPITHLPLLGWSPDHSILY